MVVINAAYFRGEWLHKFNPNNTRIETFHSSETVSVNCHMMRLKGHFYYAENKELNAELLKIPFSNNLFSFMVILPKTRSGIVHVDRQIEAVTFTELIDTLDNRLIINVCLPKFRMEVTHDLDTALTKVLLFSSFLIVK